MSPMSALRISVNQKSEGRRRSLGKRCCLFQYIDCFPSIVIRDEYKAEADECTGVVWSNRKLATHLVFRFEITPGKKQREAQVITRHSKWVEFTAKTRFRQCLFGSPLTRQPETKCGMRSRIIRPQRNGLLIFRLSLCPAPLFLCCIRQQ